METMISAHIEEQENIIEEQNLIIQQKDKMAKLRERI